MTAFDDIVADFDFLDDWEERYKYVIDLGRSLAPIEEADYVEENKVRGCASQVWLRFDKVSAEEINFRGDSDAHIVKGLIALLIAMFSGKTAKEVHMLDAKAALMRLDLEDHITPQRSNGLVAMIARIKAEAEKVARD